MDGVENGRQDEARTEDVYAPAESFIAHKAHNSLDGTPSCAPGWLFLILMALIAIPATLGVMLGRQDAIRDGFTWSESCLGGLVAMFFAGIQFLLGLGTLLCCRRVGSSWRMREGGPFFIFLIVILGLPQGAMFHNWAYYFTGCQNGSKISRARADLRTISLALEAYAAERQAYPAELRTLTTATNEAGIPYLRGLDSNYLGGFAEPRYALYSRLGTPARVTWMAWEPGLSSRWSISAGAELQAALERLNQTGKPGAWLLERIYDPTNGSAAGDIIRSNGIH